MGLTIEGIALPRLSRPAPVEVSWVVEGWESRRDRRECRRASVTCMRRVEIIARLRERATAIGLPFLTCVGARRANGRALEGSPSIERGLNTAAGHTDGAPTMTEDGVLLLGGGKRRGGGGSESDATVSQSSSPEGRGVGAFAAVGMGDESGTESEDDSKRERMFGSIAIPGTAPGCVSFGSSPHGRSMGGFASVRAYLTTMRHHTDRVERVWSSGR